MFFSLVSLHKCNFNVLLDFFSIIIQDESMRLISEGCRALLYLNLSYTDITNGTLRLLSR